jgi:hypothetical protein
MSERHTAKNLLALLGALGALGVSPARASVPDLEDGLVARYPLDGDAADAVGGHDGTAIGAVGYEGGVCGEAARMGAGYVQIPAQAFGDFTVSAWFNQAWSTGSWRRVWDFAGGGAGFFLAADNGRLGGQLGVGIHDANGGFVQDVGAGFYPTDGTWYHVVVSYDHAGAGTTVYVDGQLVGTGSAAAFRYADLTNQTWFLGHSNWADPDFAGRIDEVRLYDRALDADAVAGLYAEVDGCDADGDGVSDLHDRCPSAADTGVDADADGVDDGCDACPTENAAGADGDGDGCLDDNDGDGVPDVADACPYDDASAEDENGDGCLDDDDGDGVTNSHDQCPGYGDTLDRDADGTPDGCATGFDTAAVKLALTGEVPASCVDGAGGSYADVLPVTFTVDFAEDVGHAGYWESWYAGDWYGSYTTWTAEWEVTVGATTVAGTFDPNNYYNSWYQGDDAYYGKYVSGVVSQGGLYVSLSSYGPWFDDVRDHVTGGLTHVDGFEAYGDVVNAAGDACYVGWYGYGQTWGYSDLDAFDLVATGDTDGDGAYDDDDAFPSDAGEWADTDGDGFGDNADLFPTDLLEAGDEDSDGLGDNADPCSGFPNVDSDADEVCDASDRCPTDAADTDADNDDVCDVDDLCVGALDLDTDGDQVCDDLDLCVGNDATGDDDADGYCVSADNCPADANADQADVDGDGLGDACETDVDRDGILDDTDNCAGVPNADQSDLDGDAAGDACDTDDDADGVADNRDNCPSYANADQRDTDGDRLGDLCDGDDDADGIADAADACAGTPISAPFDAAGCSGAQRVELVCGTPSEYGWTNRGRYTSCVTKEATSAQRAGLLTGREKGLIVSRSANEDWESFVSTLARWN